MLILQWSDKKKQNVLTEMSAKYRPVIELRVTLAKVTPNRGHF